MNDLLTMIDGFKTKIRLENAYIKQWASPFGDRVKSDNAIEHFEKCISRLDAYYNKVRLR